MLTGPVWAALLLLVVAGAPKVVAPFDTMRAVRKAGIPVTHLVVRVFGAVEALIGVVGLVSGHRAVLLAAAVSYAGFTGFVLHALHRRTPLASCGCFGKADTPPTRLHVAITGVLTLALALGALQLSGAAAWEAALKVGGLWQALTVDPTGAIGTAGFAVIICWLAYLALAVLPTVGARPPVAAPVEAGRA